jgi:hypothetical protein
LRADAIDRRACGAAGGVAVATGLAAMALALAFAGCGGGDDTQSPPDPAIGLTDAAWGLFEGGTFAAARGGFRDALVVSPGYADAHNGLGWSLAFADSISEAYASFSMALGSGHSGADPYAGRAFVRGEPPIADLAGAIGDAGQALVRAPRYLFAHDATIDWRDLRVLRAQAYLALNRADSAAAEVESLGGRRLAAGDPRFVDSLAAEIERLSGVTGAAKRPASRRLPRMLQIATGKPL